MECGGLPPLFAMQDFCCERCQTHQERFSCVKSGSKLPHSKTPGIRLRIYEIGYLGNSPRNTPAKRFSRHGETERSYFRSQPSPKRRPDQKKLQRPMTKNRDLGIIRCVGPEPPVTQMEPAPLPVLRFGLPFRGCFPDRLKDGPWPILRQETWNMWRGWRS